MPYRTCEQLLKSPGPHRFLFFWGHTPKRSDEVDASCLSQWYPAPFTEEGQTYASAEHYMMAEKARLFGDEVSRQTILTVGTPPEAKALGRKVKGFDGALWDAQGFAIVVRANLLKFGQNPALLDFLLASRGRVLVEASPQDRIWGIGLHRDDPRAADPAQWEGQNLLGFALMEVRSRLQKESGPPNVFGGPLPLSDVRLSDQAT